MAFNITLLLATPECGTIKTKARERWIFSMCIPFMVAVLCLLWGVVSQCWLRCRRKKTHKVIFALWVVYVSKYVLMAELCL